MKLNSKHTMLAGYVGYTTQALAINFSPLLFITFEQTYQISLGRIGLLIAISFITQLIVDGLAARFSQRLDTRMTVVIGHVCSASGLILFSFLPDLLPSPFLGLVIPTMLTAIGGGIIEVLISPIIEACPTIEKSASMSILHSFYSWGSVATILFSTLFFVAFGIENWRILSCIWSIVPFTGAFLFLIVPIYQLEADTKEGNEKNRGRSLLRSGIFWIFFIIMFCSGASEMAMSQWASSFAETALGVDKTLGDLLGPCAFALLMGMTRVFYGLWSKRIKLHVFFIISAVLCALSYLTTALSPHPLVSLLGCSICGFSVAMLWPGTYSLATENITFGGIRMFALLAMAGDMGCTVGPSITGLVAELLGDDLKLSFLFATAFPIIILALMPFMLRVCHKNKKQNAKS